MKKMLVFQRMMWQEYFVAVAVVAAAAVAVVAVLSYLLWLALKKHFREKSM